LLPAEVDAVAVRDAVRAVLSVPKFRRRAAELADEITGMPAPEDVVPRLESLL
jgi:UDP:flavonoid glycosyltransferase YjiC (YdhE family)